MQLPPLFIALSHGRELLHLVHNLIYQRFLLLGKIAVGLLPLDRFQLEGQLLHEPLRLRVVADPGSHLLDQLPHGLPRFPYQLVTGNSFLFVEVQHILLEDFVGELGFDLPDAILRQIRLTGFCRPCHHMHMGMVAFVMEGSIPAKVLGWDVHSGSNIVAVSAEESPPRPGIVVAQPLRILPLQGDDVCPHISRVVL